MEQDKADGTGRCGAGGGSLPHSLLRALDLSMEKRCVALAGREMSPGLVPLSRSPSDPACPQPRGPSLHSTPHAHPSATKVSVKGKARN